MKRRIIMCLVLSLAVELARGEDPSPPSPTAETAAPDEPTPTLLSFPETPEPDFLRLDEISFDLGLQGEFRRRSVRTSANRLDFRQYNEAQRWEESIGTWGSGAIGGDRWLKFDFAARFGLTQEQFSEARPGSDLVSSPTGVLRAYDIQAIVFPAGKLSGTLFALQQDDRVPRRFLPSRNRRRERYGVDLSYTDPVTPMRLRYESNFIEFDGVGRDLLDDESRSEKRLTYEFSWNVSDTQQFRLTYDYSDQRDEYAGSQQRFATTRNYLILEHTLQFGAEGKHRLETIARFNDESGDLARDVYEFAPRLSLQHSEALSTWYQLQYYEDSFFDAGSTVYRGDAGLNWNPSEAFSFSANLFALQQEVDLFGDTREWGGNANLSHRSENALGQLTASLSYARSERRTEAESRVGYVTRESVTFRDPHPAYLVHARIDRRSIVITDAQRRRIFVPGTDYLVITLFDRLQLVRIRNGRINDGETVLVSYQFDQTPRLRLGRDRVDLRVRQTFSEDWNVFYNGARQFESIDSDLQPAYIPRDINRHRIGIGVQKPRWSSTAEFEVNEDSIDPYQGFHMSGDVQLVARPEDSVTAQATFSHLNFFGANALQARNTSLLDAGLAYRHVFGPESEFNCAVAYRWEDDSLFGRTEGVDLSAGLQWRVGLFTASVEAEYDVLRLPGARDEGFLFWFRLRREIPVFARR